jgi:hypothetical protein
MRRGTPWDGPVTLTLLASEWAQLHTNKADGSEIERKIRQAIGEAILKDNEAILKDGLIDA